MSPTSSGTASRIKGRITGRHLLQLSDHFNSFEVQLLTGIFAGEISRLTSSKNIDTPIGDAAVSFVIRALLEQPDLAPLPTLKNHSDLVEKLNTLPQNFPLPHTHTYTGIYIGKSSATSYALNRGSSEMLAISIWITIFLKHFNEFKKEGKDHFIYQMMMDEAFSRNHNGLQSIVLNKGWPKKNPEVNETGVYEERITGRDLELLLKSEEYDFNHLQTQYLLGAFMALISTQTNPKNIDLPLSDATRCLIIRYLKEYPENAPLPELCTFEEISKALIDVDGEFPLPCYFSKLGVVLGRGLTTINTLASKSSNRRLMPVLAVWSTMLLRNLDDILKQGDTHLLIRVIKEEAYSRGLTLNDLVMHNGWPKKSMG